MSNIKLTMTTDQAAAVTKALDIYSRLCIGQLHVVAEMVRFGDIPTADHGYPLTTSAAAREANNDQCAQFTTLINAAKETLGYSENSSHSIGNPSVSIHAKRSWEVFKVLSKTLAEHLNPDVVFKGVSSQGLIVRHTQDTEPEAEIIETSVLLDAPKD